MTQRIGLYEIIEKLVGTAAAALPDVLLAASRFVPGRTGMRLGE